MAIRAHQIKINPTPDQLAYLYRSAGVSRFVWNWALTEYKATKERGEKIDWLALQRRFNKIKHEQFPFVSAVGKSVAQSAFRDIRRALDTYYKIKKSGNGKGLGFPGYRKRNRKVGSFGLQNDTFSLRGHGIRMPLVKELFNLSNDLRFAGKILSGRVKERAGSWYLIVTVETDVQPVANAEGSVGIDFGLSRFATLSTGEICETQAYLRQSQHKLQLLQRGLARKKRFSRNWRKWKQRIGRLHVHIADQRQDFLHKFTTGIANRFAAVCVEDLCLKGLARTKLSKSFNDAGIGLAIEQLRYKSLWLQKIDRFFPSSRRCQTCGVVNRDLTLSMRIWSCICGALHDRDHNAAKNIETEGMRLLAGTGWVSATPVELAVSGLEMALS